MSVRRAVGLGVTMDAAVSVRMAMGNLVPVQVIGEHRAEVQMAVPGLAAGVVMVEHGTHRREQRH